MDKYTKRWVFAIVLIIIASMLMDSFDLKNTIGLILATIGFYILGFNNANYGNR